MREWFLRSAAVLDSFPRSAAVLTAAISILSMVTGIGSWTHSSLTQMLAWYGAFLPLVISLAILLFSNWLWEYPAEYIKGTWGRWEAHRDLSRIAKDLAVLETWRLGGRIGVSAFLLLFWTSVVIMTTFGVLFLFSGFSAFTRTHHDSFFRSEWETAFNIFVIILILSWSGYGALLALYRHQHPAPICPPVTPVPVWRKDRRKNKRKENGEEIFFLTLFREACPEAIQPARVPWNSLLFTIPEFCWYFYRCSGGQFHLPLAASVSIEILGAGSVFVSLWWLIPWSLKTTKALLHPERISCCAYMPILHLRDMAERVMAKIASSDYPPIP
ncbi:MAG: hypothetical protein ACYCYL_01415 [Acidithiobacillus sp.]